MKLRKLTAEMRKAIVDHNTVRSCDALSCQFCGGPVDGCPPARGPCPDEAHSSLRTACLPRLRRTPLSLSAAPYLPPIFSHTLRFSFNQMPQVRLPAAGGKAKAVSVDHKLAAGVAIALVFLILVAHTVCSGPQDCKLFHPVSDIHGPAPEKKEGGEEPVDGPAGEYSFSKPTGITIDSHENCRVRKIFKSEYAPATRFLIYARFPFLPLTPSPPLPQRP